MTLRIFFSAHDLLMPLCRGTPTPAPMPMAREDSAMSAPARRRAMSDAAIPRNDCAIQPDYDPLPSPRAIISTSGCNTARSLDSVRHASSADPKFRRISKSATTSPQPKGTGKLGFAHAVTPHISDIGRQLAARYALNFESARLKAPSQDLEEAFAKSDHAQSLMQEKDRV